MLAVSSHSEHRKVDLTPGALGYTVPLYYAKETLSTEGCIRAHGATTCAGGYYTVNATGSMLVLTATTDIRLPAQEEVLYVRWDFRDAVLTRGLSGLDQMFTLAGGDSLDADRRPVYGGSRLDNSVIFRVASPDDIAAGAVLELSLNEGAGDPHTPDDESIVAGLAVKATDATARLRIFDSLAAATRGNNAIVDSRERTVISIRNAVSVKIASDYAVADVETTVAEGGPFRLFRHLNEKGGKQSGVLAKVETELHDEVVVPGFSFPVRHAVSGLPIGPSTVSGLDVAAVSEPGNFAVVSQGGNLIDSNKQPWKLSSDMGCTSGPLAFSRTDGDVIEVYAEDPDGAGYLSKGDPTPVGLASVDRVSGTVSPAIGTRYFCVSATGNTEPIPLVGNPETKNEYELRIDLDLGVADAAFPHAATVKRVGAIARNGSRVHIPYLSTHEAYNQRLVIVNHRSQSVRFWVLDDDFRFEGDTTLRRNDLGWDSGRTIPGYSREVIRVQDEIELDGHTRMSAILTVAAPGRDIDVMTVDVHPGTGQSNTTVYHTGAP
ncbi:MAG: hypothetical protein F4029_16735 [Gammaproteobacteria bacterium]|nr:hypothetical protein [Gammaproteobacteria bacterium]MYF29830.1 hypothetical protein [Gammaproteobacteria bacterium]MYK47864.1 hypothetical protein [Gammaproteobacteria bacterium]